MSNKKINKILDIVIVGIIIMFVTASIVAWLNSPEKIPNHFDSDGNIKDYVSRNFIFFLATIASVLGVLLLILGRYPEKYNYTVKITEKNREIQYSIAVRMIRILNIQMLIMFGYLQYCIISVKSSLGGIIILMVIMLLSLGYYIGKSIKYK